MTEIVRRAEEIRQQVERENGADNAEALARVFEDDAVDEVPLRGSARPGGGAHASAATEAQTRLESILAATSSGPGLHFATFGNWDHAGFKTRYRDPHPSSSRQVGHYLTAVHLGYAPEVLGEAVEARRGSMMLLHALGGLAGLAVYWADPFRIRPENHEERESLAIRLMVGHELTPDGGVAGEARTVWAGTMGDGEAVFRRALRELADLDDMDVPAAEAVLRAIPIDDTLEGNSRQDMILTLVGCRFGMAVRNGEIATRAAAAAFTRRELSAAG